MTTYVFPCNPLNGRGYDPEFQNEVNALKWSDDHIASVDHDSLRSGEVVLKMNNAPTDEVVVYRGWMMNIDEYTAFYDALTGRGYTLLTSVEDYKKAHQIEGWLDIFQDVTFNTALLPLNPSALEVSTAAKTLNSEKFFIKDYVKSLKSDASLSVATVDDLFDTIQRFREEQGDWLAGGIVVREFVSLPEDRVEIRGWWRDGAWKTFTTHPDYADKDFEFAIPTELMSDVTQKLNSLGLHFVSVDFTPTSDGWKIIEIGDGQVSGLPAHLSEETITTILR